MKTIDEEVKYISTKKSRNRTVIMSMDMRSDDEKTGLVNNFHLMHYGDRLMGRVGTIIMESTIIDPNRKIFLTDMGCLWHDGQVWTTQKYIDAVH